MRTPLIVFEGIDNSGKTTLSKRIAEMHPELTWTKEPTFTTKMADLLNSGDEPDQYKRELMFLASRIEQQKLYQQKACIVDRYLWTGMAYAKVFSPDVYELCVGMYTNYNVFKKPDLYVFMETPIETCHAREEAVSVERLASIRKAYEDTLDIVKSTPVVTLNGSMTVDELVAEIDPMIVSLLAEV